MANAGVIKSVVPVYGDMWRIEVNWGYVGWFEKLYKHAGGYRVRNSDGYYFSSGYATFQISNFYRGELLQDELAVISFFEREWALKVARDKKWEELKAQTNLEWRQRNGYG